MVEMPFDVVDEASKASFPASDPPGWAIGQRYPAEPIEAAPTTWRAPQDRHQDGRERRSLASQGDDRQDT